MAEYHQKEKIQETHQLSQRTKLRLLSKLQLDLNLPVHDVN